MSTVLIATTENSSDQQALFNQAISFFNAGSRCLSENPLTPLVSTKPLIPAVVCYAFSCELYLKLLHLIDLDEPTRGHSLHDLFSALPERTRSDLTDLCKNPETETLIHSVSDSFSKWRYQHEYGAMSINPQVLVAIATACHRLVRRKSPALTAIGENETARFSYEI